MQQRAVVYDGAQSAAREETAREADLEDLKGIIDLADVCGLTWSAAQVKVGTAAATNAVCRSGLLLR